MDDQIDTLNGSRAKWLALLAISAAFIAVLGQWLVGLNLDHLEGPWSGSMREGYLGLSGIDAAASAIVLLALLYLTLNMRRWPALTTGAWALAGLTVLGVALVSAGQLINPVAPEVVIDSAGNWLALPESGVLLLALMIAAYCLSGILLLLAASGQSKQGATTVVEVGRHASARGWRLALRWVLALPLAFGILAAGSGMIWTLSHPSLASSSDLALLAFDLLAGGAYTAVALLLLGGLERRSLRLVILAFAAFYFVHYFDRAWQQAPWHLAVMLYAMVVAVAPLARKPHDASPADEGDGQHGTIAVSQGEP